MKKNQNTEKKEALQKIPSFPRRRESPGNLQDINEFGYSKPALESKNRNIPRNFRLRVKSGITALGKFNFSNIRQFFKHNFWILLAFLGILVPRFVNLNPYLGLFRANNILDLLVAPTDIIVGIILFREFWKASQLFKLGSLGLIAIGILQIYLSNPSLLEYTDNFAVTARFLLWSVVVIKLFRLADNFARTTFLGIILLYSLFDHLLLSNPVSVLLSWVLLEIKLPETEKSKNFKIWKLVLLVFLGINAVTALWQVLTGYSLGLHLLGEPYLFPEQSGVARQPLGDLRTVLLRGYGLMQHPNVLGFVGSVGLWFYLQVSPSVSQARKKTNSFYIKANIDPQKNIQSSYLPINLKLNKQIKLHFDQTFLVFGAILAILSFSRIAWLSLVWLVFSSWWQKQPEDQKIFAWPVLKMKVLDWFSHYWWLAVGAVCLFVFVFVSRITFPDSTDATRLGEYTTYFQTYGQLDWQQKLFGVGLGQYPFYLRTYYPSWDWWTWQPIHNLWLSLFFELGIVWILLGITIFFRHRFTKFFNRKKKF